MSTKKKKSGPPEVPPDQLKRFLRFFDLVEGVDYSEIESNFHHFYCRTNITTLTEFHNNFNKACDLELIRMSKEFKYYLTFKGEWCVQQLRWIKTR
jgi:hypothetical protein